ncbi:MAG: hypothetical protein HPY66_2099 [Firmicutes bacterium]|nr:hypothetical protein [Bacillota bacterium]MDI6705858.1 NAD(P)H-dependent oxidoreductase [Bacillota bacterium]
MSEIYLIMPGKVSRRLMSMAEAATSCAAARIIETPSNLPDLKGKKILFAVELDDLGNSIPMLEAVACIARRGNTSLYGSTGAVLVHSSSELYTKSAAQNLIFLANTLGCRFPGNPLVEATASLSNLKTWQKKTSMSLEEICLELCVSLGSRLLDDNPITVKNPKILALHSSSHETSNTLMLWNMVKKHLCEHEIVELHVENGTVLDCKGCSYRTCKHYSLQSSCFYGGVMVEEILPAIENSDAVVWICPNYNDSISANLMAVINRLTALYRKTKFFDKSVFGIIVSGNSGSDSVAKQLIGSLNINKSFRLPPYFALMATANDPGSIKRVPGIEERARIFAENLAGEIKS